MTAITIDKDKAIELLEKQVEKKGEEYVYEFASCQYFADEDGQLASHDFSNKIEVKEGQPLCIVGHIYADLGLTLTDLYIYSSEYNDETEEYETTEDQDQGGAVYEVHPDPEKVVLTEGAQAVLSTAQSAQDAWMTWGSALAEAKDKAQSMGAIA